MLVESQPEIYYVPAYVGHLGWIGVRLDRDAEWEELAGVIEDAYLAKAPRSIRSLWLRFIKGRIRMKLDRM